MWSPVDIRRPDDFTVGTFYVSYNGPSKTIYGRYNNSVPTEREIVVVSINPSTEVMIAWLIIAICSPISTMLFLINPKILSYVDNPTEELKIKVLKLGIANLCNNLDSCMIESTVEDPFAGNDLLRGIAFSTNTVGKRGDFLSILAISNSF